jgi:hypothetical protein
MFIPKKKREMPEHLGKLVKMFDTPENLTFYLKSSSTKIGAKLTIELAMSHGEKVDWDKVSSGERQRQKDCEHQNFSGGGQKILFQDDCHHLDRWCSFN